MNRYTSRESEASVWVFPSYSLEASIHCSRSEVHNLFGPRAAVYYF